MHGSSAIIYGHGGGDLNLLASLAKTKTKKVKKQKSTKAGSMFKYGHGSTAKKHKKVKLPTEHEFKLMQKALAKVF